MIAIDSNILGYAFDIADPHKHQVASKIVEEVFAGRQEAIVTNQVLGEFCWFTMRKPHYRLSKEEVRTFIDAILESPHWRVLIYGPETVSNTLLSDHQDFWDALLAQTLKEHGITELLTENVKDFNGLGIKAVCPF